MESVTRFETESIEVFVRRLYTVQNQYGYEDPQRLERCVQKVREANPEFESLREVKLPQIDGVPLLKFRIEDRTQLHRVVHEVLTKVQEDPVLLALSFIDPIRLGVEELGIAATPEVVAEVRARLEGHVSFDQERYEEIRKTRGGLNGITTIRWVAGGE